MSLLKQAREFLQPQHDSPFNTIAQPPWPQPSPIRQDLAPAVLHPPEGERADFSAHVGKRYARTMVWGWPPALAYSAMAPEVDIPDDGAFCELMWNGTFSHHLTPTLDPFDCEVFEPVLKDIAEGSRLYKVDTRGLERCPPLEGCHVGPGVALLSVSPQEQWRLEAIWMGGLIRPADESWPLAKIFILQGISLQTISSHHYPVHFPFDSINAITKSFLRPDHPIRSLLEPHFRFSLCLDNAVLHSPFTVLDTRKRHQYSAIGIRSTGCLELLSIGWHGIEGNSAYPAYRFPDSAPGSEALPFDRFRRGYYERMGLLARRVAQATPVDDALAGWADHIAHWIPGFPDSAALIREDRLGQVLTHILFAVTIGHGADHHAYSQVPINRRPLTLRVPPPNGPKSAASWSKADLASRWDIARLHINDDLFFKAHTCAPFMGVIYPFADAGLRGAVREMRDALRDYDRNPGTARYIPLDHVPCSIQF